MLLWYRLKCVLSVSADGESSGIMFTNSLREFCVSKGKISVYAELQHFIVVLFTSNSCTVKLCVITTFVICSLLLKALGYILCCIVVGLELL